MQDVAAENIDDYIAAFPPKIRTRLANLVHFAAFEHHVGFYPGAAGIAKFQDAIAGYRSAKGSVQFPHDEPLPLALVADIVKFRVEQNRWNEVRPTRKRS
jgi:uncharacterized protein YdhG (YjbR/CyaY superfamily)